MVAASVAAVVAVVIWRLLRGWDGWEPARVALAAGAVLVPPAIALWMMLGPLAGGWAARAGTPPSLLAASPRPTTSNAPIVLPDQATFSGSADLIQSSTEGATLTTSGKTDGETPLSVTVALDGDQEPSGFFVRTGSVRLVPPDGAAVYRGPVSGIDDGILHARLSDGFGDVIDVSVQMQISGGKVQGQLSIGTVQTRGVAA
jgi:hypothetical protein